MFLSQIIDAVVIIIWNFFCCPCGFLETYSYFTLSWHCTNTYISRRLILQSTFCTHQHLIFVVNVVADRVYCNGYMSVTMPLNLWTTGWFKGDYASERWDTMQQGTTSAQAFRFLAHPLFSDFVAGIFIIPDLSLLPLHKHTKGIVHSNWTNCWCYHVLFPALSQIDDQMKCVFHRWTQLQSITISTKQLWLTVSSGHLLDCSWRLGSMQGSLHMISSTVSHIVEPDDQSETPIYCVCTISDPVNRMMGRQTVQSSERCQKHLYWQCIVWLIIHSNSNSSIASSSSVRSCSMLPISFSTSPALPSLL